MTPDVERGPVRRPALSRCIGVDVSVFEREHWGRAPLLSVASDLPTTFDDLFSEAAVDELVSRRGVRTPFIRMAREGSVLAASAFTSSGGLGAEVGDQVDSAKVLHELAGGSTIVLQGLHRLWPPLIDFTTDLVRDLGHPAQVNAYITPSSSRGFDPHYDVHDVFVLQIAGEKHWTIHAPVHEHPTRDQPWSEHRAAVEARAAEEPTIDAVLKPGDALYLPRGWIHSAQALGGTSVHLTIGMPSYTRRDVLDALVARLRDDPSLRTPLPLGADWSDPELVGSFVDETVQALTEALADGRIDRAAVGSDLAHRFVQDTRPEPVSPLSTVAAMETLDADTCVRWRNGLQASLQRDAERVRIVLGGRTIALPVEAAPAVERLSAGEPVLVGDLPDLDLDSAVVVARRLLREAVLVVA